MQNSHSGAGNNNDKTIERLTIENERGSLGSIVSMKLEYLEDHNDHPLCSRDIMDEDRDLVVCVRRRCRVSPAFDAAVLFVWARLLAFWIVFFFLFFPLILLYGITKGKPLRGFTRMPGLIDLLFYASLSLKF